MGEPDGRSVRERMIRGFFVAGTSPAVQTKVPEMMLRAPEATAVGRDERHARTGRPRRPISRCCRFSAFTPAPRALRAAHAVHASFPSAEYTEIAGTGHFLMLEKPEEFNALLLGFLSKQKY